MKLQRGSPPSVMLLLRPLGPLIIIIILILNEMCMWINSFWICVRSVTGIGLLVDNARFGQCPKNAGRVSSLNGD